MRIHTVLDLSWERANWQPAHGQTARPSDQRGSAAEKYAMGTIRHLPFGEKTRKIGQDGLASVAVPSTLRQAIELRRSRLGVHFLHHAPDREFVTAMQYTVKPGDSLGKIAGRAGISLDRLMAANPSISNPNVIRVGQTINVPTGGGSTSGGASPPPPPSGSGSGSSAAGTSGTPRWISIARGELGVAEVAGYGGNNARILEFIRSYGYLKDIKNKDGHIMADVDETPWCACFVNWCLKQAGQSTRNTTAAAKSWLNWGVSTEPRVGAVIVVYKGGGQAGTTSSGWHVAFYTGKNSAGVPILLGGNQGNAVSEKPFGGAWTVKGYRWPQ